MNQNIQILLETVVRCGGSCSGCALSSFERMSSGSIDWDILKNKAIDINNYLLKREKEGDIESISLFLGQGDHFLLSNEEMKSFVEIAGSIVPDSLKHKTVLFITASAIGKEAVIKEKMDMFYDLFLEKNMPFFIQVVFDPKKMKVTEKFSNIYINNILYFKQKCGMTELTINVGNDLFEAMSPSEFHDWVLQYGFKHVEMNWVMNAQTKDMWKLNYKKMFDWFKEYLEINFNDHQYEINFIPFLARAFKFNDGTLSNKQLVDSIKKQLVENLYIDKKGHASFSQSGLVSNLIPINERLLIDNKLNINDEKFESLAEKTSNKILSKILRDKNCSGCHFKNTCAQIGSSVWLDFESDNHGNCQWGIKDFLQFIEKSLYENSGCSITFFDKNPVQNLKLSKNNNANFEYFENKFNNCSSN